MPRIISVTGQKGGIGKTTATVHIAARLADLGYKTCIIDFDTTQSNATRCLLGPVWEEENNLPGICDLMANGGEIDSVIYETPRENLYIIPSEKKDKRGANYNIEAILNQLGLEGFSLLKELIDASKKLESMHFVLIDNAPSLGITTVSALIASDYFLIPVQTADLSMESIGDTITAAFKVKKLQNEYLEPLGFFVASMDKRPKMAKKAIGELMDLAVDSGIHFYESIIPISTKFAFLPRDRKTIYDVTKPSDRGHKEYIMLVDEILERIMEIETVETNTVPPKSNNTQTEIRAGV
ncbi:MAG: ParA family protein [Bacteriovoracaceae bacterium]|jgi:chromosome partitioning protein|nr:ParA family protein [Bacteriovoracaceae bacterium]